MRLADFILANTEAILAEWETFARSVWPSTGAVDPSELRDHAADILRAVARDMQTSQTPAEQSGKSKGEGAASTASDRLDGASREHGAGRVTSGFKVTEVIAEYRALRASVLRLWRESTPSPDVNDLEDVTRFNEAIDQSVTKAIVAYTTAVDRSRQMFLAVLGHDLRGPLAAIDLWAKVLARKLTAAARDGDAKLVQPELVELAQGAANIVTSSAAMTEMVHSLTDFAYAALGGVVPISPASTDLAALCREVIAETQAAFPGCHVRFEPVGDLTGEWDAARLRQVLSNLLINAVQHGEAKCEVDLSAGGEAGADTVTIAVHNTGPPIAPHLMGTIFDPFVRLRDELHRPRRPGSLGLGLFIARETITAHGGDIHVVSSRETGTTFIATLPRRPR